MSAREPSFSVQEAWQMDTSDHNLGAVPTFTEKNCLCTHTICKTSHQSEKHSVEWNPTLGLSSVEVRFRGRVQNHMTLIIMGQTGQACSYHLIILFKFRIKPVPCMDPTPGKPPCVWPKLFEFDIPLLSRLGLSLRGLDSTFLPNERGENTYSTKGTHTELEPKQKSQQ